MFIQQIENKAGIKMEKIGVPQPEQVIKASSRDTINLLKEVNQKVVPLFEEAAQMLIDENNGDAKVALCRTLALLSGHHKEEMTARSLLNGQEDCMTFQVTMDKPFYAVSLIWNILRRYLPENIHNNIKGMRVFVDNTGACFDVPASEVQKFEDIFEHETSGKTTDFKVSRALSLPELKEDMGYGVSSYGRQGGYGNQGGYGRSSYGN